MMNEFDDSRTGGSAEDSKTGTCTEGFSEGITSPEYVPENKTDGIRLLVYRNETAAEILKIISHTVVAITVYALFYRIMILFESGSFTEIIKLAAVLGVPFIAVSILRRIINAPRPYELLPFYEKMPKKKSGRSFPSRHVFSVFAIAVALIPATPLVGALLLFLGVLLAFVRVALGIHFVRDVLAGAAIGLISGVLAIFIV